MNRIGEYQALLKQFDKHLAKGVYARYYDTSPHDLAEVGQIVELETRSFYREGDNGEFTLPNTIIYWRESRLYVSYIRNGDGSHSLHAPHSPTFSTATLVPLAPSRL